MILETGLSYEELTLRTPHRIWRRLKHIIQARAERQNEGSE
jgi:hypothetical protein